MRKPRKKRIFGMTSLQLSIIAVLLLIVIGLIFGGLSLIGTIARPGGFSEVPASEGTFVAQPLITPDMTQISELSLTTTANSGGEPLPEDWKQFIGTRFELSVPPQFVEVNVVTQRQERIDYYRAQGYAFLADDLDDDSFDYRFWFNFPQPETIPFPTSIYVKDNILPTNSLDEYIDQAYGANLQGFMLADRQTLTLGEDIDASRVLLTTNLKDVSIGVADYAITDGVNLWIIRAGSSLDEFYTWLPDFDRVARSFKLLY